MTNTVVERLQQGVESGCEIGCYTNHFHFQSNPSNPYQSLQDGGAGLSTAVFDRLFICASLRAKVTAVN